MPQFEGKLEIESDGSDTRIFVTIPFAATVSVEEELGIEPLQAVV